MKETDPTRVLEIPESCEFCGSQIVIVSYKTLLPVLKDRQWRVCKGNNCRYEEQVEDHKNKRYGV